MEGQQTAFACPVCHGELDRRSEELFCASLPGILPADCGRNCVRRFLRGRPPRLR